MVRSKIFRIPHLNGVKSIFSRLKFLRKTAKEYSGVLERGKYYVFPNMRSMCAYDNEVLPEAKKYFIKNESSRDISVTKWLNRFCVFTNRNNRSSEKYQAMYLANNYDAVRETKLFSFKRKKVLVICTGKEECQSQLDIYKEYKDAYNLPEIQNQGTFDNSYEISLVSLKNRPDHKYALENVVNSCIKYNSNPKVLKTKTVSELVEFNYDNETYNETLEKVVSVIDKELLTKKISLCIQHGDLSVDNLIYGECDGREDFWWIDWEHAFERPFFYDFYFYILNTAFCVKDETALSAYIGGEYNEILNGCFNYFGLKFDETKLKDYFYIFFAVFLKERICDKQLTNVLKLYVDYVEKFVLKQNSGDLNDE